MVGVSSVSPAPVPIGGLIAGVVPWTRSGAVLAPERTARRIPSGFDMLDRALSGGLAASELTLLGGRPGSGKTVATLQWARHAAGAGHQVLYVCYEHEPEALLTRLLAAEIRDVVSRTGTVLDREELGELLGADGVDASSPASRNPAVRLALDRLAELEGRLMLVRADSSTTTDVIDEMLVRLPEPPGVLVVDYLQRVPVPEEPRTDRTAGRVAEHLKELAARDRMVVVATCSLDDAGLSSRRVGMRHIDGPPRVVYEADLVVLLNAKDEIVLEAHIADDPRLIDEYRRRTVFTVEKNRSGEAGLDLEFDRDFAWYRFVPRGAFTAERLVGAGHGH